MKQWTHCLIVICALSLDSRNGLWAEEDTVSPGEVGHDTAGQVSQAHGAGAALNPTASAWGQGQSPSESTPALALLPLFTAASVPKVGPEELPIDPPRWIVSTNETASSFPGGGLGRHPMLYIGEGCNTMFLVNQGRVIWTYSTGKGWEYDDIWLMSNGNILFSRQGWAGEVTPQKKIVWRMDATSGGEIHTVQPIGLDRVLLMENGTPAKLRIVNKKTGTIEVEHAFSAADTGAGVHAQFRRLRMTGQGTYLVRFFKGTKLSSMTRTSKRFGPAQSTALGRPSDCATATR